MSVLGFGSTSNANISCLSIPLFINDSIKFPVPAAGSKKL